MPRRFRRRAMHYTASTLHDGTVLAAYPMRKPAPRIMKRDHVRPDADGVLYVYSRAGQELSDTRVETRTRFQDIIAVNLNTRRAIRELVLPAVAELREEVAGLRAELHQVREALASRT